MIFKLKSAIFFCCFLLLSCFNENDYQMVFTDSDKKVSKTIQFDKMEYIENTAIPQIDTTSFSGEDEMAFANYRSIKNCKGNGASRFSFYKYLNYTYEGKPSPETLTVSLYIEDKDFLRAHKAIVYKHINSIITETGGPPSIWFTNRGNVKIAPKEDSLEISFSLPFNRLIGGTDFFVWEKSVVRKLLVETKTPYILKKGEM
jgi:hypothetical protein